MSFQSTQNPHEGTHIDLRQLLTGVDLPSHGFPPQRIEGSQWTMEIQSHGAQYDEQAAKEAQEVPWFAKPVEAVAPGFYSKRAARLMESSKGNVDTSLLYNHVLDDDEYCYVLVLKDEKSDKHKGWSAKKREKVREDRERIVTSLLRAGLALKKHTSIDGDELYIKIGAPQRFIEFVATRLQLPVKFKKLGHLDDGTEIWVTGYKPFELDLSHEYVGINQKGEPFKFGSKSRLQIVDYLIREMWAPELAKFGAKLDMVQEVEDENVVHFFPLHDMKRIEPLRESWGRWELMWDMTNGMSNQPYNDIKDYFGEQIALYFCFIGFYTDALQSPMFWGIITGIIDYSFRDTSSHERQWIRHTVVNLYCLQIIVWASMMLENWKRQEAKTAFEWGMRGLSQQELPLANFDGEFDKVLDTVVYNIGTEGERQKKVIRNGVVVFFMCCAVSSTMVFYVALQFWASEKLGAFAGAGVGVANAVTIIVFNQLYKGMAEWLTEIENHRTATEYLDSLILKRFLFQFVNSYFSLYLTAFVKPWAEPEHAGGLFNGVNYTAVDGNVIYNNLGTCGCAKYVPAGCDREFDCTKGCTKAPKALCDCDLYDCQSDVGVLLLTVFGIQIFVGNFSELVVPFIMHQLQESTDGADDDLKSEEEKQALMTEYDHGTVAGVFEDYNELVLQFGFVTLFAVSFPFVSLLAFCNNLVEIRADAVKLINMQRRPPPVNAERIGAWFYVMEVMAFAAVATNCANIFFVSHAIRDVSWPMRLLGFIVTEHGIIIFKLLISISVPDISMELQRKIDHEEASKYREAYKDLLDDLDEGFKDQLKMYRNPDEAPPFDDTFVPFPAASKAAEGEGEGGDAFPDEEGGAGCCAGLGMKKGDKAGKKNTGEGSRQGRSGNDAEDRLETEKAHASAKVAPEPDSPVTPGQ